MQRDTIEVTASVSVEIVIAMPVTTEPPQRGSDYREWFVNQLFGMLGRIRQDAKVELIPSNEVSIVCASIGSRSENSSNQSYLSSGDSDYAAIESALEKILPTLPEVKKLVSGMANLLDNTSR